MRIAPAWLVAIAAAAACAACHRGDGEAPAEAAADPLAPLHAFEEERRGAVDFARLPPSDRALGADPIAIRALPAASAGGAARFVGILRGRDAVVLLDERLAELGRLPAPALPSGLAVTAGGEVLVVGEQEPAISRYRVAAGGLARVESLELKRIFGLRDVAAGARGAPGHEVAYAVDEREGRLFSIPLDGGARAEERVCDGPFRVAFARGASPAGDRLLVDCLFDHALVAIALDARGMPLPERAVIRHDGPIWGFDAIATPEGLVIAAGGVEDHPLDRTGGSFGFIDSFVFLYRIARGSAEAERLAQIEVSREGVITPKAIALHAGDGGLRATVVGYGGDRLIEIAWGADLRAAPAIAGRAAIPGIAAMARAGEGAWVFADPLFDAWIREAPGGAPEVVRAPDREAARSPASRLGEALFFTRLMAPYNRTEGALSRFTCETCHLDGYVDGRTHHTGRGDVRATTKPLLGLFNNRPHFSRALDPDLATMVHSEFRVAGAKSDHDPWFSASRAELPWIDLLDVPDAMLEPLALRRALMTFLMDFTHRPNPASIGRSAFTPLERRGAEAFAARCEACHAARLASDVPASRVPFAAWEARVLSREGPIVWGDADYHATGVEPYVHEKGARAPSLRRLYKKHPYFTNGSAKTLRDVLDRARIGGAFFHDGAPPGARVEPLDAAEKDALAAFLELL